MEPDVFNKGIDGTEDLTSLLHRTRSRKLTGADLIRLNEILTREFGTDYQAWNPLL